MDSKGKRQLRRIVTAAVAIVAIGAATAAVAMAMGSHPHRSARTPAHAVIGAKHNAALGEILDSGSRHMTVYVFGRDRGTKSHCTGACASAWPPVTTATKPRAMGSARSADLGTTRRAGAVKQVTYHGHPLYLYQGDGSAKAAAGQGIKAFGGRWYAINPAGHVVTKSATGGQPTTPGYGGTSTTPSTTTPSTTTTTPTTTTQTTTTSTTHWS